MGYILGMDRWAIRSTVPEQKHSTQHTDCVRTSASFRWGRITSSMTSWCRSVDPETGRKSKSLLPSSSRRPRRMFWKNHVEQTLFFRHRYPWPYPPIIYLSTLHTPLLSVSINHLSLCMAVVAVKLLFPGCIHTAYMLHAYVLRRCRRSVIVDSNIDNDSIVSYMLRIYSGNQQQQQQQQQQRRRDAAATYYVWIWRTKQQRPHTSE